MNKKRLLIILFGILVFSLAYAVWRFPRQERVTPQANGATQEKRRNPAKKKVMVETSPVASDDLRVRLDLLSRDEGGSTRPRRDLFAFLPTGREAVVASPPPVVAAVASPPPPSAPVEEPTPPAPPPLPSTQFAFLGFLQKEVEKTIFLAEGGEIFVVKKGDWFGRGQQYFISELTAERLVIQQRENQPPITLSIAETRLALANDLARSDVRPARPLAARSPIAARQTGSSAPPPEETAQEESEPTAAEIPAAEQGIIRPLSRSDLNNIFSEDKEQSNARPVIPPQLARPGLVMPSEEVPR
jgi:hypothetical protein